MAKHLPAEHMEKLAQQEEDDAWRATEGSVKTAERSTPFQGDVKEMSTSTPKRRLYDRGEVPAEVSTSPQMSTSPQGRRWSTTIPSPMGPPPSMGPATSLDASYIDDDSEGCSLFHEELTVECRPLPGRRIYWLRRRSKTEEGVTLELRATLPNTILRYYGCRGFTTVTLSKVSEAAIVSDCTTGDVGAEQPPAGRDAPPADPTPQGPPDNRV